MKERLLPRYISFYVTVVPLDDCQNNWLERSLVDTLSLFITKRVLNVFCSVQNKV